MNDARAMLNILGLKRCSSIPLACAALLLGAGISDASAASFGELTHFGSKGTGHGQFTERSSQATPLGVDPTDNSVYVADEPEEHVFRIQKLSATGEYQASVSLKVKGAGSEPESGIEGVAVDPVEKRIYVLAVQSRGDEEHAIVDPEVLAAGAIYAFSTTPKEGKLEPAPGTKEGGLLTSPAALHAQSKVLGQALLEPSGITVDPMTHDVILMGTEDEGEGKEPEKRVALERVAPNGVLDETRWSDSGVEPFFASSEASSPAVSNTGNVYVLGEVVGAEHPEQIDEIPASFSSAVSPKPFVAFDSGANELVTFPGTPAPLEGGGMSIAPDGTVYVYAKVHQESGGKVFPNAGALAFDAAGVELGWTGGQDTKLGLGHCTISPFGHPAVAAGSGQHVFMFDSNPEAPSVIEFGPEGGGCTSAKSSAPAATVLGSPKEPVEAGDAVKLASTVSEANALSTKWSFGDGSAEVETGNQHQAPETTHTFNGGGVFKVKETIRTDNLNTPELSEEKTITVKSVGLARFSSEEVTVGQPSSFDAKSSTGAEGSAVVSYKWEFGDGSSETTSSSSTAHTYAAAGSYEVKLRVEDALKRVSAPVAHVTIVAERAHEEAKPPCSACNTPSTGPTTTGSSPGPAGTGGVLAFKATLSSASLLVAKSGSLGLKLDCAGQSVCVGTVALRTLTAVSAGKHKSVLTLASGSFSLAGGQVKTVTLRLSTKGRALLARSHSLKAKATLIARDSAGALHTMTFVVTLRPQKTKKHH